MDSARYGTALVDSSVEVLHDFLSTILQLKASLRVIEADLNNSVSHEVHRGLELRLEELGHHLNQALEDRENALREAEANRQKASHIDTFVNEINTFKTRLNSANERYEELEKKHTKLGDDYLAVVAANSELENKIKQLQKQLDKLQPPTINSVAKVEDTKKKTPYRKKPEVKAETKPDPEDDF